jgi:hypothetical protein
LSADALAKLAASLVLLEGEPTLVKIEERCLLPAVMELIPQEHEVHHMWPIPMATMTGASHFKITLIMGHSQMI